MLEAFFILGNNLSLLYIGGSIFPISAPGEKSEHSLIPLYVDFKHKKCHNCMTPIIDFTQGLYCSNIFQGITNQQNACYKFVCRDCLGEEEWHLSKGNLFYRCACCLDKCPPTSHCKVIEKISQQPQSMINADIYWY